MLACLWSGARFVLIPKWTTSRFWDISLEHGCTWLPLSPHTKRTIEGTDIPRGQRYRLCGDGICGWSVGEERLGARVVGAFGMTETISHPIVGDPYLPNRPGSMGRAAPEYGVVVVRDDGVTPVEPGETGELLVKGARGLSLFAEYLNDPEATAASFDAWGWFRTGDMVTPHSDGHISYVRRAKDMLKVSGENVAAAEVERVVLGVPGVTEVAVVGRPDQQYSEVPVAFVVAAEGSRGLPGRIAAHCKEHLADFKVPRDVYIVRELPRSTLRKVNKTELRKVADPAADRRSEERKWLAQAAADPSGDAG
jgi:crotonobetaine/carnitine-CoA ligase